LNINAGFDQVAHSLAALGKLNSFHGQELDRYSARAKEARAATTLGWPHPKAELYLA
jgi:hypothetical protein